MEKDFGKIIGFGRISMKKKPLIYILFCVVFFRILLFGQMDGEKFTNNEDFFEVNFEEMIFSSRNGGKEFIQNRDEIEKRMDELKVPYILVSNFGLHAFVSRFFLILAEEDYETLNSEIGDIENFVEIQSMEHRSRLGFHLLKISSQVSDSIFFGEHIERVFDGGKRRTLLYGDGGAPNVFFIGYSDGRLLSGREVIVNPSTFLGQMSLESDPEGCLNMWNALGRFFIIDKVFKLNSIRIFLGPSGMRPYIENEKVD